MSELKPCPFCGAKEEDEDEPLGVWWSADFENWQVLCDRCGANTGWINTQDREETIAAWNRRTASVDCEAAEHDSSGCLGYSTLNDDEPIDRCKSCEKYTGNRSVPAERSGDE